MLDNDQKLEIMKEAYRNNYKGSFTELFMQNDPEGNDPELMMPAPNQPTAPTPSAPSPMSPSPSTPENFQPESQKLVQSYKTAAPEDMPMGDAVKDVVQEPLEYKEGGYKLSEYTNIPYDPTVSSSSYIKNYTSNYDDGYKKFEEGGYKNTKGNKSYENVTIENIKTPEDYDPFPLLQGNDRKAFFQMLSNGKYSTLEDSSKRELSKNSKAIKLYNAWQDTGQPKLKYTSTEDLKNKKTGFKVANYNSSIHRIEADNMDGFIAELEHAHQFAGSKKEKTNLDQKLFSFDTLKKLAGTALGGTSNLFLNKDQKKKNLFNLLKKGPEILGTIKGLPYQLNRFQDIEIPGHEHDPYEHQGGVEGVHNMPGAYGYEWGEGLKESVGLSHSKNQDYNPSIAEILYNKMYNTSHEEKTEQYQDPNYFLEGYPETEYSKQLKMFNQIEEGDKYMETDVPDDVAEKYPWMQQSLTQAHLQHEATKNRLVQRKGGRRKLRKIK